MFRVVSDYFATGEGRTLCVLYTLAGTETQALTHFEQEHGDWYAIGAEAEAGWRFDDEIGKNFVTEAVRKQLEDPNCNRSFASMLHFNYS